MFKNNKLIHISKKVKYIKLNTIHIRVMVFNLVMRVSMDFIIQVDILKIKKGSNLILLQPCMNHYLLTGYKGFHYSGRYFNNYEK